MLLALIAGLVGVPSLLADRRRRPPPRPSPSVAASPGRTAKASSGDPSRSARSTARTQADRDLVALVFSGLVRNGPDGTIVPDLAERWSVDPTGATLDVPPARRRALARRRAGHRRGRRVHDPTSSRTRPTRARRRLVERGHGRRAIGAHDGRRSRSTTPLGGFLQAATQPIAPAHLLAGVPVDELADDPFGQQPIGSGPFAVASLDDDAAELDPGGHGRRPTASPAPGRSPRRDRLAGDRPRRRPADASRAVPGRHRVPLLRRPDALADGLSRGRARRRLGPAAGDDRASSATAAAAGLLRYPGSTLTAVLLNLRPGHPEFARSGGPRRRCSRRSTGGRSSSTRSRWPPRRRRGPIPPSSALFDPAADPAVPYDRGRRAGRRSRRPAGRRRPTAGTCPGRRRRRRSSCSARTRRPTRPRSRRPAAVARDWTALGLAVTHVPLPPGEFVTGRLAERRVQAAVGDVTIGLDPDLYPLLASSQTVTGGSNVIGLQDPALDKLLVAARGPGTDAGREGRLRGAPEAARDGPLPAPAGLRGRVDRGPRHASADPSIRQVADPADRFWDVLTWRLAAAGKPVAHGSTPRWRNW